MKLKCVFILESHRAYVDFTIGKEYKVIKKCNESDRYDYVILNDEGRYREVHLYNDVVGFMEIEDEPTSQVKFLTGLEAIKLMEQGKIITNRNEMYCFKIMNGAVHFKSFMANDDDYIIDYAFNFRGEYKEYIEPKPKTGWERVEENQTYYTIAIRDLYHLPYRKCDYDECVYEMANHFSTKEKAEEIKFKQTLFRKLQRYSDMNGGTELDWSNTDKAKHFIYYDQEDGELSVTSTWRCVVPGTVYFTSREIAKQAVELFHEDLIKYYTM